MAYKATERCFWFQFVRKIGWNKWNDVLLCLVFEFGGFPDMMWPQNDPHVLYWEGELLGFGLVWFSKLLCFDGNWSTAMRYTRFICSLYLKITYAFLFQSCHLVIESVRSLCKKPVMVKGSWPLTASMSWSWIFLHGGMPPRLMLTSAGKGCLGERRQTFQENVEDFCRWLQIW